MTQESYNFNDTYVFIQFYFYNGLQLTLKPSVYIRNINEKVSINTIKSKLTEIFDKYGPIQSITAHKNIRMRGQAFVSLESEEKSQQAIKELNGTQLFEKKIEVSFAKSSSNSSVENKLVEKDFNEYLNKRKLHKEELDKKKEQEPVKKPKIKIENLPPNKILLVQGLPKDVTQDELMEIFEKYNGFVEVRLVAVRGVAFIEYENDKDAIPAKEGTVDLTIKDTKPIVNFAKK